MCPCIGAAAAEPVVDEPPQAPQLPSLPSPPEIVRSLTDQLSSFSSNGDAPSLTGVRIEQLAEVATLNENTAHQDNPPGKAICSRPQCFCFQW